MTDRFRLGLFYPTSTSVHWQSPLAQERNPDVLDAATHVRVVRAAEAAGLDYVFAADAWGSRGPVSEELELGDPMMFGPILAGVLIGATQHIKVITTMHQAWIHPLVIARMGANLDALSGGRWGMNAVSGVGFNPELLESVTALADHDAFYAAAAESMEIILQAWTNDGVVDLDGAHFQAKGRLVGPMPAQQPHPLIVSAGASPAGCEFAGRYASVAFIPGRASAELIADRRAKIRDAAVRAGRDGDVRVYLHASVLVGDTQQEAEALSAEMLASVDLRAAYELVTTVTKGITTYEDIFAQHSEEQLRDLGLTAGTLRMHGDAATVAGAIEQLQQTTGCDGLSLSFPIWQPEQIERFGATVVPLLEQRGVWTRAGERGWPW